MQKLVKLTENEEEDKKAEFFVVVLWLDLFPTFVKI